MPLNIRSEEVNRLADKLASVARVSKTEAVRMALANELERRQRPLSLAERIKPIQDRFAYACARRNDPPLHVVGNDLPQTGIPSAMGCPVSASR